ncbi:CPBP family intramembrane glutamic endopeptidase [Kriegella aquimaris]|uniref:CPBP family intramembrane glutamic endopeptidase n=1 Tax=Kriegella aquimaris TaxID=192904 RepID=UPI000B7F9E0C|nr:type II CAAX endopeptidase family protein [Kriegella aquimaris]
MIEPTRKIYPDIAQSFGITGIVILGTLLFTPVNLILNKLIGKEASMLIYYLLAIGIPFWIVYLIKKKKTGHDSFNIVIENKRIIPFVMVGTIVLLFGIISPIANLIPMPEWVKKMFIDSSYTGFFAFLVTGIAAPILEELIFRGIILDGLLKKYAPTKSILISSLLFGLVHLNPWQFVSAFIIGIFSGWVYYRTKSLSFSIIIHATSNFCGFLMLYFISVDSLMDNPVLEIYGGFPNLIMTIIGSVFTLAFCIYSLGKEFEVKKCNDCRQKQKPLHKQFLTVFLHK